MIKTIGGPTLNTSTKIFNRPSIELVNKVKKLENATVAHCTRRSTHSPNGIFGIFMSHHPPNHSRNLYCRLMHQQQLHELQFLLIDFPYLLQIKVGWRSPSYPLNRLLKYLLKRLEYRRS